MIKIERIELTKEEYKTNLYKGGHVLQKDGYLRPFPKNIQKNMVQLDVWEGRGYSGGHVSQSDWDVEAEDRLMVQALKEGFYCEDVTRTGRTGGYYPAVKVYGTLDQAINMLDLEYGNIQCCGGGELIQQVYFNGGAFIELSGDNGTRGDDPFMEGIKEHINEFNINSLLRDKEFRGHIIKCSSCGEELSQISEKYWDENPNSCDLHISQLQEEHDRYYHDPQIEDLSGTEKYYNTFGFTREGNYVVRYHVAGYRFQIYIDRFDPDKIIGSDVEFNFPLGGWDKIHRYLVEVPTLEEALQLIEL